MGFTYIMTNHNRTVLYVGSTVDLIRRCFEHKNKVNEKSFTARYNINKLVYYEQFDWIGDAIMREKQIKSGSRKKKVLLINSLNLNWEDLSLQFL